MAQREYSLALLARILPLTLAPLISEPEVGDEDDAVDEEEDSEVSSSPAPKGSKLIPWHSAGRH